MFEKHTIAFGLILSTQNALDVGKILLLMISVEAQGPNIALPLEQPVSNSFQFNK